MVKKEVIKDIIDELSRERESMIKSYSHKPHLASLPHDLRTNDPELLQERLTELSSRFTELESELGEGYGLESLEEYAKSNLDNDELSKVKAEIKEIKKKEKILEDYYSHALKIADKLGVDLEVTNFYSDFATVAPGTVIHGQVKGSPKEYIVNKDRTLSPIREGVIVPKDAKIVESRWITPILNDINANPQYAGIKKAELINGVKRGDLSKVEPHGRNKIFGINVNNSTTKTDVENLLRTTKKPIVHTEGLSMRNPTTYRKLISSNEGINKLTGLVDVTEYDEFIEINTYHENDFF